MDMNDIDLVYLWVNGNDPKWKAKRDACIGAPAHSENNCEGRFSDHDELKYSLRSVHKYAPWIRKIFIVTDEQVPQWLDTSNPKIQIIDHKEILPPESLPCFNSVILEHQLYKINGLSEHFLYANDDTMLNQPVLPSTFFATDGFPIVRMFRRPLRRLSLLWREKVRHRPLDTYMKQIQRAATLVSDRYGIYYRGKPHHNIDAYCKSDYAHTREVFGTEIDATLEHHMRSDEDIQRTVYTYTPLAMRKAHSKYVSQRTSFLFHIYIPKHYEKFRKYNPTFFCMNDSQNATEAHRQAAAKFLQSLFPDPSPYELPSTTAVTPHS